MDVAAQRERIALGAVERVADERRGADDEQQGREEIGPDRPLRFLRRRRAAPGALRFPRVAAGGGPGLAAAVDVAAGGDRLTQVRGQRGQQVDERAAQRLRRALGLRRGRDALAATRRMHQVVAHPDREEHVGKRLEALGVALHPLARRRQFAAALARSLGAAFQHRERVVEQDDEIDDAILGATLLFDES
jgi:hypothetical protein